MSSSDLAGIPGPAQPAEGTETLDELFLLRFLHFMDFSQEKKRDLSSIEMLEVFPQQGLTGRGGRKTGHWVKMCQPLFPGGEGLAEI